MSRILFYSSQVSFSFSEIQKETHAPLLTSYELQAWQFCHEWLWGTESFTLHTSGSTGTPKPIVLARQQMAASAAMTGNALQLKPGDAALVNMNVQYIAGIMMLVRGLELGLSLTVIEPSSDPLAAFPVSAVFEFQSYVPLQLQTILQKDPEKIRVLQTAKAILVGGAPVPVLLEDKLQILKAPVYQTYGMTETVSHVALRRLNTSNRQDFYEGLQGIFFETDDRGCLIIHASLLNTQTLVTNDRVELLSPSRFRWLGRADYVINSGGVKVQAEKVEAAVGVVLARYSLFRRFFVTGLPHPQLGETVVLIMEGEALNEALENSIFQQLKTSLIRYEQPRQIRYIPLFSETATAKVDRKQTLQGLS